MKKAIYLDSNERHLARRCFKLVIDQAKEKEGLRTGIEKSACNFLKEQVMDLDGRFEALEYDE